MRHLVPLRTASLLHERRPALSWIQHTKLLKNAAISPIAALSNATHFSKQRSSTYFEELRALNDDWQKRLDEQSKRLDEQHHKRLDEQYKLRIEDAGRIAKLECAALSEQDEKLKIANRFNIRGALERIAFYAGLRNIVPQTGGVQMKLDILAQTTDFKNILNDVVADRKLVLKDVQPCVGKLYHETSKHAHGNWEPIIITEGDFVAGEVAALEAFMKLQDKWPNRLVWIVKKAVKVEEV